MTIEEIKAMRLARQNLVSPVSPIQATRDLCGVQAQFLSNALHALRIRTAEEISADQFVKTWTLRGTMHVIARDDLPLMLHNGRTHFLRPCDTMAADEHVTAQRKQLFASVVLHAIADGTDERDALKATCMQAGMTEEEAQSLFDPWGGLIRALCEAGHICHKLQQKKAYQLCEPFVPMQRDEAMRTLVRRYLQHYGPATLRDASYFFGMPQTQLRPYLQEADVMECGGVSYYFLPGEDAASIPPCLFLAGFDPLMLGYQKEDSLYLPKEYLRGIFNMAGIVMPALLLEGRVTGRWKKTGRKISVSLFESIHPKQLDIVHQKAENLWPDARIEIDTL